jgi:putative membrane protein
MILHKMAACAGLAAGLAVGLATAGCSGAATSGKAAVGTTTRAASASPAAAHATTTVSSQDRKFMDQASQINLSEIALGSYMHAHGSTTAAKNLGARYFRDHTAAQADLRALASRLHVTLATTPGATNDAVAARVEASTGKSMDIAFASASVTGHKAAIAIFKKEESAGSDPAVKAYAAKYLPMLEAHLKLAESAELAWRGTRTS